MLLYLHRIRQVPNLRLQNLLRKIPQIRSQLGVKSLLARLRDLPIRNDVLALNPVFYNIWTRGSEQCRPAALLHRVLHERPHHSDANGAQQTIRVFGLLLLIGGHAAWMNSVYPRLSLVCGDGAVLTGLYALDELAGEEHLG